MNYSGYMITLSYNKRIITMNEKKLLAPVRWLALLFLICGSCEKSTVENQQDGVALKTHLSLIDAITLERPEAGPAIGRIRSITVLDDYIIVVDATRESVEVFDRGEAISGLLAVAGMEKASTRYRADQRLSPIPTKF